MTTSKCIPPELFEPIIDSIVDEDSYVGSSFALVSRNWRRHVNKHRFHRIFLTMPSQCPAIHAFADLLDLDVWPANEGVAIHVRYITFQFGDMLPFKSPELDEIQDRLIVKIIRAITVQNRKPEATLNFGIIPFMHSLSMSSLSSDLVDALYDICCKTPLRGLSLQSLIDVPRQFFFSLTAITLQVDLVQLEEEKSDLSRYTNDAPALRNVKELSIYSSISSFDQDLQSIQKALPLLTKIESSTTAPLNALLARYGSQLEEVQLVIYPSTSRSRSCLCPESRAG